MIQVKLKGSSLKEFAFCVLLPQAALPVVHVIVQSLVHRDEAVKDFLCTNEVIGLSKQVRKSDFGLRIALGLSSVSNCFSLLGYL